MSRPVERFMRALAAWVTTCLPAVLVALPLERAAVAVTPDRPIARQVRELTLAIEHYRELAGRQALDELAWPAAALRSGDRFPGAPALRRWLAAVGDMPADQAGRGGPPVYDEILVGAVRRFQLRHGLEPDGILGRSTVAALRLSLGVRVRQLEQTRARLEALQLDDSGRIVLVNIPLFRLWAWEAGGGAEADQPAVTMRVIVGRAGRTPTPELAAAIDAVVLRPFWDVPQSIVRGEILPQLEANSSYLDAHRMLLWQDPSGVTRIRQLPGPDNALGLVKFVFPNAADVYMHDTPTRALFEKPRRDFSHGCIRLERPLELAAWMLGAQGWSREQVESATRQGPSVRVGVVRPVVVALFYGTAWVGPDDRLVYFVDDIYARNR
ncbi:MAG: L,D-transpeptidase family protein [Vicinamibacterales bacterium]